MLVALTLLLGCRSPEVTAFLDDRAAAICARHVRCDSLGDAGYASEDECLTTLDASTEAQGNDGDLECDAFDAASAEACLAAYESAACDEPVDVAACDGVCG